MGARILEYLHARGEALNITSISSVRGVYSDYRDIDWNDPDATVRRIVDDGFNVIFLAFWLSDGGAVDHLGAWGALPAARRQAAIAYAHARGAVVMASLGGSTDHPFSTMSGAQYGRQGAEYALAADLDGA